MVALHSRFYRSAELWAHLVAKFIEIASHNSPLLDDSRENGFGDTMNSIR